MARADTVPESESVGSGGQSDGYDPVPGAVDWLLGALVGLVGLVVTAVGVGLYRRVDRAAVADVVASEDVEVNGLTESEFVTAAGPFVDWFAVGAALTGLALLGGAVAFVVGRRRTRRRVSREGGTTATFWASTVYGAAVTTLGSSVVPLLPAVAGGGVAAHLRDGDDSARTGAVAGLVGSMLLFPLLVFTALGLNAGASAIGKSAEGGFFAVGVVVAGLLSAALQAGFGALGGALADRLG